MAELRAAVSTVLPNFLNFMRFLRPDSARSRQVSCSAAELGWGWVPRCIVEGAGPLCIVSAGRDVRQKRSALLVAAALDVLAEIPVSSKLAD
jgi:hypothetical protein